MGLTRKGVCIGMGKEYIDREKAMEIVKRTSGDYAAAWSEIRQLPAAGVAPVLHGKWIVNPKREYDYICSVCGGDAPENRWRNNAILTPYCPNCGAKMDGGK